MTAKDPDRAKRLAASLRDNLKRRKAGNARLAKEAEHHGDGKEDDEQRD